MNIATGEVLTGFQTRHAGVDVPMFSKQIDATLPRGLAVHVVMENPRPALEVPPDTGQEQLDPRGSLYGAEMR